MIFDRKYKIRVSNKNNVKFKMITNNNRFFNKKKNLIII